MSDLNEKEKSPISEPESEVSVPDTAAETKVSEETPVADTDTASKDDEVDDVISMEEVSDRPLSEDETDEIYEKENFSDYDYDEEPLENTSEKEAHKKDKGTFLKKAGKFVLTIGSLGIMFYGIILVLNYIFGAARGEFHSDSTDTIYWAEAAMQGNGLINPDFKYAALMPFGGNIFMQIWIPFFGVSMTSHTLGMTTFFAVFVIALFWMLSEMKWSIRWKGVTIGGLLMTLSLSEKLREIFWGHIIYYSLGMLFLIIGLAIILHIYNLREKEKVHCKKTRIFIWLAVLLVVFTVFCTNSTTAIALFALPILAALFCERFLDHSAPLFNKKTGLGLIMFLLCGISVIAGIKIGEIIADGVIASYANAYSHFSDTNTWWEHIEGLPLAFLNLMGLNIDSTAYLMSIDGIKAIMLIAFALMLVILPIVALFCYGKIKDTGTRMIIISHFVVTAFILVGYICGLLNAANWRLSPIIVTAFITSVAFMRWIYLNTEIKRLGILLLLPFGFIGANGALTLSALPKDSYLENENYKLAQFLEEQGLDYGYATFWYAQAITIQSDSAVKTRNVDINAYGVSVNNYQSNIHWYEAQPEQDKYFLLMNYGERDQLLQSTSELLMRERIEMEFNGFFIWVFSENIF